MLDRRLVSLLITLLMLAGPVSSALAQGSGEESSDGLRLICLTGLGCGYSPLTDEDMGLALPDGQYFVFEDLIDAPPAEGAYNFTYPATGLVCGGVPFNSQPEDSIGSFEVLDGGEQVLAEGLSADSLILDRYGPGFYAGVLTMADAGGTARYAVFTMVTGETSVSGFVIGRITSPDGTCEVWTTYLGNQ
jgi:hypothetical protein